MNDASSKLFHFARDIFCQQKGLTLSLSAIVSRHALFLMASLIAHLSQQAMEDSIGLITQ